MRPDPASIIVGGFTLGKRIGRGRLGRVYRACKKEQEVAIKLLAPDAELDDPAAKLRFEREVNALASLEHPNVVPVIDFGVDEELGPYLVMPHLEGRTLRELFSVEPSPQPKVVALGLRAIASGLGAMHEAGFVHRDVKPENIVIRSDGQPIILDLGLVWSDGDTRHTEEGTVAGSIPYMAPEQIDGGEPSPATDLWALGVIAHEWITGTRPFQRGRQSEEVAAILSGRFDALTQRDPRVGEELGALLDGCLRQDPQERPKAGAFLSDALTKLVPGDPAEALEDISLASHRVQQIEVEELLRMARHRLARGKTFEAAELVDRAAAHAPHDPVVLSLANEVGQAPAHRGRHRHAIWIAGAALVIAVLSYLLLASPPPNKRAEDEASLVAAEIPEAVSPDPWLIEDTRVPTSEALIRWTESEETALAVVANENESKLAEAADPSRHARYLRAKLGMLGSVDRTMALIEKAVVRFPGSGELWLLQGQALLRTGKPEESMLALDRAIGLAPELAIAYAERGDLLHRRGQLQAAYRDLREAERLAPQDPAVLVASARLHLRLERPERARQQATRATELDPGSAKAWLALATTHQGEDAIAYIERAIAKEPRSVAVWRSFCFEATEQDHGRSEFACQQAELYSRNDLSLLYAMIGFWQGRGQAEKVQQLVTRGLLWYPDHLKLWLLRLDLDRELERTWDIPVAKAKACSLGHSPSCDAEADSTVKN